MDSLTKLLESAIGLSLNETLLVVALLLVLIDIFFASDAPSLVAYVLISVVVARQFDAHILYQTIVFVLALFGMAAFHYLLWRRVLEKVSNRLIAPTNYSQQADSLAGQQATVSMVDGKAMLERAGDLWIPRCESPLAEGDNVVIVGRDGAVLDVRKQT